MKNLLSRIFVPVFFALHAGCAGPEPAAPVARRPAAAPASRAASTRPGINDRFKNRPDPAEWLKRFEVESREIYRERERIADAIGLRPGMAVADIGAGTGFFTLLFARRVGPGGTVWAVDIAPTFLDEIARRARAEGLANVRTVLGRDDSTALSPASVDLAFVCATYHHFEFPEKMLHAIRRTLRPGGRLVVIDFERIEGTSRQWVLDHVRADRQQVAAEIRAAGFEPMGEITVDGLTENYLLQFRRP